MQLIAVCLQSWTLNPWSKADLDVEEAPCIGGGYCLRSTYSCLAVMEMGDPWLGPGSSLCCWRWSRIDCAANGPLRGVPGNAPWLEGMGPLFSCSDLCPLWKQRWSGGCEVIELWLFQLWRLRKMWCLQKTFSLPYIQWPVCIIKCILRILYPSYPLSKLRMACTNVSSPLSGSDLGAG